MKIFEISVGFGAVDSMIRDTLMETPQVTPDDWKLLWAYVQGDEGAFELLVKRYFPMVYAMAVRQLADEHLAQDVAQSVFIILSRKAAKLSSRGSLCGWLARTTRLVCLDARRMRGRRWKNEQRFAASLETAAAARNDNTSIEALLNEALVALTATEQAGVIAHFLEGRNFKEVGEMLAIGEDAAQKRVSRSLDKLRAFLSRRGAKVPVTALTGMLAAGAARHAAAQTIPWPGAAKVAGRAKELADHAMRALWWRTIVARCLKVALVLLLVGGGFWAGREWQGRRGGAVQAFDPRIESLGQAWSRMVLQFDGLKQRAATMSPNDPGFQTLLTQMNSVGQESTRIRNELAPLLVPPRERDGVTEFLTAEVTATLNLDRSQRAAVHKIVRDRLARGATLKEAMANAAREIPAMAKEINAVLSREQRQRFDRIYGVDASGFFAYLKAAAPSGHGRQP